MAIRRSTRTKNGIEEMEFTRGKAIRLKCLDCCCWNAAEVRRCPVEECPLWGYRCANPSDNGDQNMGVKS